MTLEQIHICWEAALARAERECDQAYAHSPHMAREKLERYFYLMRVCACRSSLARVQSLGAAAVLSLKGFRPWTMPELTQMCERDFSKAWMHADPPSGDGMLYRWVEALYDDTLTRRGVIQQVQDIFGLDGRWKNSGLDSFLQEERNSMPEKASWIDEAKQGSGGFYKPSAGRNRLVLIGEPEYKENNFGRRNLEIPTDKGVFSTTQRSVTGALADYAGRHRGKAKGATLTFTSNGESGTAVRYSKVEVK